MCAKNLMFIMHNVPNKHRNQWLDVNLDHDKHYNAWMTNWECQFPLVKSPVLVDKSRKHYNHQLINFTSVPRQLLFVYTHLYISFVSSLFDCFPLFFASLCCLSISIWCDVLDRWNRMEIIERLQWIIDVINDLIALHNLSLF